MGSPGFMQQREGRKSVGGFLAALVTNTPPSGPCYTTLFYIANFGPLLRTYW